jgi:integrase
VPSGSIERLPSGKFRAVLRAGRDPITKKYLKVTETCDTESQAILARERMLAQVEAESHPDRAATVAVLMARWMDVVDHELSTVETTAGYVRRTINPVLGELPLRKLQYRVDLLDRAGESASETAKLAGSARIWTTRSPRSAAAHSPQRPTRTCSCLIN